MLLQLGCGYSIILLTTNSIGVSAVLVVAGVSGHHGARVRDDRVNAKDRHGQSEKDEKHVLGDHVRSGRHIVQGVRQAQFDHVRVNQYVPSVARVPQERHDQYQVIAAARRRERGGGHCETIGYSSVERAGTGSCILADKYNEYPAGSVWPDGRRETRLHCLGAINK